MNQSGPVMDIIKNKIMDINSDNDILKTNMVTISAGQWSEYIQLGKSGNDCQGLKFRIKDQEIRPKNQAIRIWLKNREEVKVNLTEWDIYYEDLKKRKDINGIPVNWTSIDTVKKMLNDVRDNLGEHVIFYKHLVK